MAKGAIYISAVVTLVLGTLAASLGLGVANNVMNSFGQSESSTSKVEFQNFVEDVESLCGGGGSGFKTGTLNMKSGQEINIDVSENFADVSGADFQHTFSCDIVNTEDVTYTEDAAYTIYPREGGVSLG